MAPRVLLAPSLALAASLAGACNRSAPSEPRGGAERSSEGADVPPACLAIGDFRMAQFVAQGVPQTASAEDRDRALRSLRAGASRVADEAPELRSATERLVDVIPEVIQGHAIPSAKPGQPMAAQDADVQILEYQKARCPAGEWGGIDPVVLRPTGVQGTTDQQAAPGSAPAATQTGAAAPGSSIAATPADGSADAPPPPVTMPGSWPRLGAPSDAALPWMRTYMHPAPWPNAYQADRMREACFGEPDHGLSESPSEGPRLVVIGDSAANVIRTVATHDPLYHWIFASHCGERFGTVIDDKRLDDALGANPDALVIFLGSNNTTESWGIRPDLMDKAQFDLKRLLDATDRVRCRVIVDLPEIDHPDLGVDGGNADTAEGAELRIKLTRQINDSLHAAKSRPGVVLADYAARASKPDHTYIWDQIHPTPAGINLWINTVVEAAQGCFAPPVPTNVSASALDDVTEVSWSPPAGSTEPFTYVVERSDGKLQKAPDTTTDFAEPALEDAHGDAVRFRVRTVGRSGAAVSPPSEWVAVVDKARPGWMRALAMSFILGGIAIAVWSLVGFSRVPATRRRSLAVHDTGLALVAGACWVLVIPAGVVLAVAWAAAFTIWCLASGRAGTPPDRQA